MLAYNRLNRKLIQILKDFTSDYFIPKRESDGLATKGKNTRNSAEDAGDDAGYKKAWQKFVVV